MTFYEFVLLLIGPNTKRLGLKTTKVPAQTEVTGGRGFGFGFLFFSPTVTARSHTHTLTSCLFLSCGEIVVRIPLSFTFVRDTNKLGQLLHCAAVCYNGSQLLPHSSIPPCTSQAAKKAYLGTFLLLNGSISPVLSVPFPSAGFPHRGTSISCT